MTAPASGPFPGTGGVGDVSGRVGTIATDTQGPLQSGDGDQYNHNWSVNQMFVRLQSSSLVDGTARVRAVGFVMKEEAARVRNCFVRPQTGFDRAEAAFADSGLAVLSGPPGSGRRTAAIRLLDDAPQRPVRIRVLLPDPDDEPPFLDAEALEDGERLLLELSAVDSGIAGRVQEELSAYCDAVARRHGRLVVVVSEQYTAALRDALPVPAVPITPPEPEDILRSHLSYNKAPVTPGPLDDSVRSRLAAYPADEAARVAEVVTRLAEQPRPDPETAAPAFGDLVARAMEGAPHWAGKVSELVNANEEPRQRAVLLAAAMLNGYSTDAAFEAAEILHSRAGSSEPAEQEGGLANQGFIARLESLHVQVSDRTIGFSGIGYDAAVRNRFWDDFPHQHDTFRAWVEQCAHPARQGYTALEPPAIAALGQRFAEQYLRTRGTEPLLQVVQQWIAGGDGGASRKGFADLVLGALERMLRDGDAAPSTRRSMRDWARNRPARPIARVLIGLCENVLGITHPPQAIVRLRHLARHWDAGVAEEARDSLMRLAAGDRSVHRTLISVVAHRMVEDHREGRPVHGADCELLRLSTAPALLRWHGEHAPAVSSRERSALAAAMAADTAEVRRHAETWLKAYALGPPQAVAPVRGAALPGRLGAVVGAALDSGRWSALYGTVVRWRDDGPAPPSPQRRREVADLVITHVRTARRSGSEAGSHEAPTPKEARG